jgi:hypothetical protein
MNISDLHKRINDWLVSQTQPYYIEIEVGPVTLEYGILKTYNDILRGSYLIARNLDNEQATLVLRAIPTWIRS